MLRGRSFLRKAKGKKKPSSQRDVQDLESDQQQRLPYELLLDIFSYIEDQNDNLNLCRTCKLFRSLVEPHLYKTINLDFNGQRTSTQNSFQLLKMIQNPRLWNVITAVRVTSQPCHERVERASDQINKCTCSMIDEKLGTALQSIQTLEALGIQCTSCMNLSTGRHRYLTNLGTRRMRHFSYECHCSMGNSFDLPTLFTAPCMQSLNGLSWFTNLWTTIPSEQLEKLLRNPKFLPQLNALHYSSSEMLDKLLTGRKIVRLSGIVAPTTWTETHPSKKSITHLSVYTYILSPILDSPAGIKQFCNLQHIGTLSFYYIEGSDQNKMLDIVNRVFNTIVDLKRLSSIDGTMNLLTIGDDPWDQVLFARLESAHPKLRKIFLTGHFRCVWVRRDGSPLWTKHELPHFTSWDMITDRFDRI